MTGRLIGITAIRNRYDKLAGLLRQLEVKDNDTLVFFGDYIYNGVADWRILERLQFLTEKCNCKFMGNYTERVIRDELLGISDVRSLGKGYVDTAAPGFADLPNCFLKDIQDTFLIDGYKFISKFPLSLHDPYKYLTPVEFYNKVTWGQIVLADDDPIYVMEVLNPVSAHKEHILPICYKWENITALDIHNNIKYEC